MKAWKKLLLCGLLAPSFLTGCSSQTEDKLNIVVSMYPEYEWVKAISEGVDNINLRCLIDNNIDLHSYQPSVDDVISIAKANLFIYVGGESDAWVNNAIAASKSKATNLSLLNVLGDRKKAEEEKEGMQEESEEHEHEEAVEYDEHVWNSLQNAKIFVNSIKNTLIGIDANNKEKYQANAVNYLAKIDALENKYKGTLLNASQRTLVVADRFPFRYLFDDYGLDYYAAFKGCSTDSEASFETVIFLSRKVDELGLDNIIVTTSSDGRIGESVKQNTTKKNQTILKLNSLETATNNRDYLSLFEDNLKVLVEATK